MPGHGCSGRTSSEAWIAQRRRRSAGARRGESRGIGGLADMLQGKTEKDEGPVDLRPVERAGQGWRVLALEAKRDCEAPEAAYGDALGHERYDPHTSAPHWGQVSGADA